MLEAEGSQVNVWRLMQRRVQGPEPVSERERRPAEPAELESELGTPLESKPGAELPSAPSELALKVL